MKNIITALALLLALSAQGQDARSRVLVAVEESNPALEAARSTTEARKAEARSANNLPDPTVTYDHLWGRGGASNVNELNVIQGFDFPTAYFSRSRHARSQAGQFDAEYGALRQQTLLEADMCLIEIGYLQRMDALLRQSERAATRLAEAYARRVETGDAGVLDGTRTQLEASSAHIAAAANAIELEAAMGRLETLCSGPPPITPAEAASFAMPGIPPLEDALVMWMQGDASLDVLRTAADAASRQVGVARSEALPRFEVGYRRERAVGEQLDGVKMGVSIPLFESRSTVRRARAEQAAADISLQGAMQQTAIEVKRLHANAVMLLSAWQRGEPSPGNAVELAAKALDAGAITLAEYYDKVGAANLLARSQLTLERDLRRAVATLTSPAL